MAFGDSAATTGVRLLQALASKLKVANKLTFTDRVNERLKR